MKQKHNIITKIVNVSKYFVIKNSVSNYKLLITFLELLTGVKLIQRLILLLYSNYFSYLNRGRNGIFHRNLENSGSYYKFIPINVVL
jgi:hypothetical protein